MPLKSLCLAALLCGAFQSASALIVTTTSFGFIVDECCSGPQPGGAQYAPFGGSELIGLPYAMSITADLGPSDYPGVESALFGFGKVNVSLIVGGRAFQMPEPFPGDPGAPGDVVVQNDAPWPGSLVARDSFLQEARLYAPASTSDLVQMRVAHFVVGDADLLADANAARERSLRTTPLDGWASISLVEMETYRTIYSITGRPTDFFVSVINPVPEPPPGAALAAGLAAIALVRRGRRRHRHRLRLRLGAG